MYSSDNRNARLAWLFAVIIAIVATNPIVQANTLQDYAVEIQRNLKDGNGLSLAMGSAKLLLDKGILHHFLRDQITIVRPILVAGRALNDQTLLADAKLIVLASNKVVVDGVDEPDKSVIGQVAFALPELVFAYKQLKDLKMLDPTETARTEQMLKMCAAYWVKERPVQSGDGNLDMRYAYGVVSVGNTFPDDPNSAAWKKWGEGTFYNLLRYPVMPDGKLEGAKGSLHKVGNGWRLLPDAVQPQCVPSPGITENCNGYVAATVNAWLDLGDALGKRSEMATPAVEAWLDTFYQQVMPNGVLPVYGDSSWASSPCEWMAIFEWAGAAFKKPCYRMAAQRILDYCHQQHMIIGDASEPTLFVDESLPVIAGAPLKSVLLMRQSDYGVPIPDKIILRGNGDASSQPYVMLQAKNGGGHSHPFGAGLSSYALGQSVVLHDFGYDGTAAVFQNMFLITPPSESFLGFFGDPKGTLLAKIDPARHARLTTLIPTPDRLNTDADCEDFGKVSYGRVSFDCGTTGEQGKTFTGRGYRHTREVALEKDSGILVVFDTLTCLSPGDLSAGPVWHAQSVLAQNGNGFLVQDENPFVIKPITFTCPPHPVWIAMAGPKDQTHVERVTWHFMIRSGREEVPQNEHLSARYTGPASDGQTLCFLTVFAPQPVGSTTIPANVTAQVDGDKGVATVGDWVFRFGAQTLGSQAARFSAFLNVNGQSLREALVSVGKAQ